MSSAMLGRIRAAMEPSLVLRTAAAVLVAFVVVWGVLLGYQYKQALQIAEAEPGLKRFGDAVLMSVSNMDDPAQATAAVASTAEWVNIRRREIGRLPGTMLFELRDAQGRVLYRSPLLREWPALEMAPGKLGEVALNGYTHRVYEGHSPRWQLRVAEPRRSTRDILEYNASVLLPYLLLALPFVLVPVWLSARTGLKPLRQLAAQIAQRDPDSLQPVDFQARHRELKPLVRALDDLMWQLRQKLARERGFVQDAAHELRTPLAVVTAQADVLAGTTDAAQRTEARAQLEKAVERVSHLARQLLVLASLDEGNRPVPRRVDVAQAVRRLMAQVAPAAMARGIELSLEAPDALWCMLDEPALESIVSNLVDNAVRYGRDGGSVAVRIDHDADTLTLAVQDDGPGIDPQERDKVFERFHRGAGHDRPGGAGRRAGWRWLGDARDRAHLRGRALMLRAGAACAAPRPFSSAWRRRPRPGPRPRAGGCAQIAAGSRR
ncbi:MAG: sensor histidine kinase [Ramlibacter sp.]|nr:sensor histidine kinase [Ramlibacter sp.]